MKKSAGERVLFRVENNSGNRPVGYSGAIKELAAAG